MLLLNAKDIQHCVELPEVVDALTQAHLLFAKEPPIVPQRLIIAHDRQDAFSLFMPALLPASQAFGIKVSSFHPTNPARNLASINGVVLLIDVETGQLKAMLDSATLTSLRTSAMSALVTDVLCPTGRLSLAVVGAGAQARAHLRAMIAVRDFERIFVVSRTLANGAALVEELAGEVAATLVAVNSIEEAVADADVICTATSHNSPEPLIYSRHIKRTVHINAVGGSTVQACEVDPDLLRGAQVYVDNIGSARLESGEIAAALATSSITPEGIFDVSELVARGGHPAASKKAISYFRCVGHASQDIAVAAYIYKAAIGKGAGNFCGYFSP